MANGRTHLKWFQRSLVFFIPLLIYLEMYYFLLLLILSGAIVNPDVDTAQAGGKRHRFFITHSPIWSILILISIILPWLPHRGEVLSDMLLLEMSAKYLAMFGIPVIVHLILDIPGENKVGKYCIRIRSGVRLSGTWTVIWLVMSILLLLGAIVLLFYIP